MADIVLSADSTVERLLAAGAEQMAQGAPGAARASFEQACAMAPDRADTHFQLACAHASLGERGAAEQSARTAIALDPGHAGAMHILGALLVEAGEPDLAAPWLRRSAELKPRAQVFRDLGATLAFAGDLDGAREALLRAIELDPLTKDAVDTLVRIQPVNDGSPAAEAVRAIVDRLAGEVDSLAPTDRSRLLFAIGKSLEDRGQFDRAFACLAEANALRRAELSYEIDETERRMESIAEVFDQARLRRWTGAGDPSDRPIFIVGMPRSGTTLAEQIISAHPEAHGAGEIPNLTNWIAAARGREGAVYPYWAEVMDGEDCRTIGQAYLGSLPGDGPGRRRVTDKWVDNFMHLGLIHACLPNATIIHCRRDPRDTCLSCFSTRFAEGQDYAYDLVELGRYWRAYDQLMDHWRAALPPGRMLEVPYESVVADVEGWARRLIDHCGLAWDDACLRFYESKRQVRSASFAQVRQPIYTGSVGRWRPFAGHLRPLLEVIGEPWLSAAAE